MYIWTRTLLSLFECDKSAIQECGLTRNRNIQDPHVFGQSLAALVDVGLPVDDLLTWTNATNISETSLCFMLSFLALVNLLIYIKSLTKVKPYFWKFAFYEFWQFKKNCKFLQIWNTRRILHFTFSSFYALKYSVFTRCKLNFNNLLIII